MSNPKYKVIPWIVCLRCQMRPCESPNKFCHTCKEEIRSRVQAYLPNVRLPKYTICMN